MRLRRIAILLSLTLLLNAQLVYANEEHEVGTGSLETYIQAIKGDSLGTFKDGTVELGESYINLIRAILGDINREELRNSGDTIESITKEMNERYKMDRGYFQKHFDDLDEDRKIQLLFSEAILKEVDSGEENIEKIYSIYESIYYNKNENENIVEYSDGIPVIKKKFRDILTANGVNEKGELKLLSLIFSLDYRSDIEKYIVESTEDEYTLPYKIGVPTRENMMLAAIPLVGQVRYVWGGGHIESGNILGISPAWKEFFDTYGRNNGEPGYNKSIKTKDTWCPVHGRYEGESKCSDFADIVYSLEEYTNMREGVMEVEKLKGEKFTEMIESEVNFENGVASHRLDGLDCSGYTNWLYNQIDMDHKYDSLAVNFIPNNEMKVIELGDKMLPGDVLSWGPHIVVIVGENRQGSGAYVMVEASPNMVKFGVIHYSRAKKQDIEECKNVAGEANSLIGNIGKEERLNVHNISKLGYKKGGGRYIEIGRYSKGFIDEYIVLPEYSKRMVEMDAKEIIQHTINKTPRHYILGEDNYKGKIFKVPAIEDVKDNVTRSVKDN